MRSSRFEFSRSRHPSFKRFTCVGCLVEEKKLYPLQPAGVLSVESKETYMKISKTSIYGFDLPIRGKRAARARRRQRDNTIHSVDIMNGSQSSFLP